MSSDFYTAEEAMKVLGKPRSTFFKEVGNGKIPSILEPGKKRGRRFPKEAIDLHAKLEKKHKAPKTKFSFTQATNSDLWIAVENARKTYGDDDYIPYSRWLEWRDINDQMTMTMKENDINMGYSTIIPIGDKTVINDLLHDHIREKNIPIETIKKWTDRHLLVYIAGTTIVSSGDKEKDTKRGQYLLAHTIKWAIKLYHQYDIKSFYAVGATEEGRRILEHLGFTEIISLHNGERKGYVLDSIKKTTKLTQMFIAEAERE